MQLAAQDPNSVGSAYLTNPLLWQQIQQQTLRNNLGTPQMPAITGAPMVAAAQQPNSDVNQYGVPMGTQHGVVGDWLRGFGSAVAPAFSYATGALTGRGDDDQYPNTGTAPTLNGKPAQVAPAQPANIDRWTPTQASAVDPNAQPTGPDEIASLMASLGNRPDVPKITPTAKDFRSYVDQIKDMLPSTTAEDKQRVKDFAQQAQDERQGAYGNALMATGLKLLGTRGPFLNALSEAAGTGINTYEAQKQQATQQQMQAIEAADRLASADERRAAHTAQTAATLQSSDQMNDYRRQLAADQAYQAQYGNNAIRAQLGLARLQMGKNPNMPLATTMMRDDQTALGQAARDPVGLPDAAAKAGFTDTRAYLNAAGRNAMLRAHYAQMGRLDLAPSLWPTQAPANGVPMR